MTERICKNCEYFETWKDPKKGWCDHPTLELAEDTQDEKSCDKFENLKGGRMKDFAYPGREALIFFDPGDKVRWHENNGQGPFEYAKVIRTARTRVLIERETGRQIWVPNLHLSHDPEAYGRASKGM